MIASTSAVAPSGSVWFMSAPAASSAFVDSSEPCRAAYINGQSILPLGSWTPLMYAARQGSLESTKALLAAGADMNQTDPDGATALVLAIINANYDVAAALIEKGADPNIGDKEANMAALYAAVDMHRLAIGHGRPNPKPSGNLDAVDVVKLLLAHRADPNAKLKAPLFQRQHTGGDR